MRTKQSFFLLVLSWEEQDLILSLLTHFTREDVSQPENYLVLTGDFHFINLADLGRWCDQNWKLLTCHKTIVNLVPNWQEITAHRTETYWEHICWSKIDSRWGLPQRPRVTSTCSVPSLATLTLHISPHQAQHQQMRLGRDSKVNKKCFQVKKSSIFEN